MKTRASRLVLPALFVYFLYFAIPALKADFASDDPMNLRYYWGRGVWRCLIDSVNFWGGGYRPMGALFYLPIYHFAVLNPLPYRVAVLAIVAASLYFTFRIVEELTQSQAAAALATVIVCSHRLMALIYYNTSMIYDLMAYFFVAAMLLCYLRFRRDGHELTIGQSAWIVILYIAALDSKEMAVAGAAWILAWEVICRRPPKLLTPGILAAITLIYSAARVIGPNALASQSGYRLEPTLTRFFTNNLIYANDILRTSAFDLPWKLILLWSVIVGLAAVLRRREGWWCCAVIFTATLPTSFTVWPRADGSLCIPLLAWVVFGAMVMTTVLRRIDLQWLLTGAVAILWTFFAIPAWQVRAADIMRDHRLTSVVIAQLHQLPKHPEPHSRVIFMHDPFEYWDMRLIADLFWNDPTLQISLGNKLPEAPDLSSYDWVLSFEGETLHAVRTR